MPLHASGSASGTADERGRGVALDKKEADKWYALAIKSGYIGSG